MSASTMMPLRIEPELLDVKAYVLDLQHVKKIKRKLTRMMLAMRQRMRKRIRIGVHLRASAGPVFFGSVAKHSLMALYLSWTLLYTSGCHPISVKTDYHRGASFAGLRTYAWHAAAKVDTRDPRFDTPQIEREIRNGVDAALAAKGFRQTETVPPDFLVGYSAKLESGSSTVAIRRTLGDSSFDWGWTSSHTVDYETGALMLEMTDPTTQRMLWRAVASAVVIEQATSTERQERIGKAVRKMLDDFPPQ
jgi:uncharacterized protein DUF4136